MRYISSIAVSAAAVSLALAYATSALGADVPNFNEMDRNNDGALTRSEAQGNPKLAERFSEVDGDGDGKLSRAEYLGIMARQDLHSLRENLAEFLQPEGKPPLAAAAGEQASAGASAPDQDVSQAPQGQEVPPPVSEQLVRSVQERLKGNGVDAGPVDGIWGPRTSSGVREFQEREGIDATGQLSVPTLAALGILENAAAGAEQQGADQRGASAGDTRGPN